MCTRVLWNEPELDVVVGRTMDWPTTTEPIITVLPRGLRRDGGKVGPAQLVQENPLVWTSKHGSVVVTVYGIGTADGVNEHGLAAHMLYLTETDFGPRNPALAGLQAGLWAQYLLDNATTVSEALGLFESVQLIMASSHGRDATVHLAIEDATGDSAVIEYLDGKPHIFHGHDYTIMTNSPPFDEQLHLLAERDFSNPSSDLPLPGNVNPVDRFHRAHYFRQMLPEPKSEREAIASILSIMRNVSVPFGAPYKDTGVYNTEYRTAVNLTSRRYFFELTTSPNVIWVDLNELDFSAGAPVLEFDPERVDLCGDITGAMQAAERAPF